VTSSDKTVLDAIDRILTHGRYVGLEQLTVQMHIKPLGMSSDRTTGELLIEATYANAKED